MRSHTLITNFRASRYADLHNDILAA